MWSIEALNKTVEKELASLPDDQLSKLSYIADLIESFGLENVKQPYVKYLQKNLWEIRLKGKSGIGRAIFVKAIGNRIVIVRAFVKKTQKTPKKELDIALKRAKEVQ